jgi:hypothetical protein
LRVCRIDLVHLAARLGRVRNRYFSDAGSRIYAAADVRAAFVRDGRHRIQTTGRPWGKRFMHGPCWPLPSPFLFTVRRTGRIAGAAEHHDFTGRAMLGGGRQLMRLSSIGATMACYVDLDSAEAADQSWASYGNTPAAGDTLGNTHSDGDKKRKGVSVEALLETPDAKDLRAYAPEWTG